MKLINTWVSFSIESLISLLLSISEYSHSKTGTLWRFEYSNLSRCFDKAYAAAYMLCKGYEELIHEILETACWTMADIEENPRREI